MGQTLTSDLSDVNYVDLKSNLVGIDVLVIFGVGDGSLYRSLSSWLKKEDQRFLVFVEREEEVFLRAKELPLAKDPKVRVMYWQRGDEQIFQQIAWEFVFLKFGYGVIDQGEVAREFFVQMEHYHRGVDLLASDCQDMGQKVLTNALKNLEFLTKSRLGQALEGKCAGVPAIICGAGPSLNHAVPQLKELQDKALVIAGGSAVRALNAQGITPHVFGNIDPEPPFRRFLEQDSFESPFFYQGRVSHDLLALSHGPLFWMPDGGSYPLESWLAAECGAPAERFDGGWTVANFCAAIAAHLGCSPIIFVGMDFSCGPNEIYASKISGAEHDDLIEIEKDKLYSKRDWMMSAEWMGAFAHKHPEIQWINVSQGGIAIPSVEKRALSEELFVHEWDIPGIVQGFMDAPLSEVSKEQVDDVRKKVKESFETCLKLCDAQLKVWEQHYPNSPLEKTEYALLEIEMENEICHRHFLLPLWNVWKRPILRSSFHPLGQHIHRLLFFKKAIETHISLLRSFA